MLGRKTLVENTNYTLTLNYKWHKIYKRSENFILGDDSNPLNKYVER